MQRNSKLFQDFREGDLGERRCVFLIPFSSNAMLPSPQDPKHEIQKVMQFMGRNLNETILDKIVQETSFEKMKENPMTNRSAVPTSILDQSIFPFMRKGLWGLKYYVIISITNAQLIW